MNESISVSALNGYVKMLLESDEVLSQVWVEGEISGFLLHNKSGHAYFTLKDGKASVRCVMWKSYAQRVRFVPEDGMYVVARCKVSFYERDGAFQLSVEDIIPKGVGTAKQQLDALRDKLASEGLFSEQRKRPLVRFPKKIAVITSSVGAAIKDVMSVAERRCPFCEILLFSVNVQGLLAVESIVKALDEVNRREDVDEVIITRGGGSKEDLWYFNSEQIVRAAARLRVPFISAVGHEIDYTLLDYCADARAATPSAAAEIALVDIRSLLLYYRELLQGSLAALQYRLDGRSLELESLRGTLRKSAIARLGRTADRLDALRGVTQTLDPQLVLKRGYACVFRDSLQLPRAAALCENDRITVSFFDGEADCTVNEIRRSQNEKRL